MPKKSSTVANIIASYKQRNFPFRKRSDYFQYLLGLASEIRGLKDHALSLEPTNVNSYVYIILNPLKKGRFTYLCPSGYELKTRFEVFYVGKGTKERAVQHIKEAKSYKGSLKGKLKISTIRKIWKAGKEPKIVMMPSRVSSELALAFEIDLIAGVGRKDLKMGPLSNLTDGGEGHSGRIQSAKERSMRSITSSFRKKSQEHILKVANAKRGVPKSEESKIKVRANQPTNKSVIAMGTKYQSVSEAARTLGITVSAMRNKLRRHAGFCYA